MFIVTLGNPHHGYLVSGPARQTMDDAFRMAARKAGPEYFEPVGRPRFFSIFLAARSGLAYRASVTRASHEDAGYSVTIERVGGYHV